MANPSTTILPYPFQLPQDYAAKNAPGPAPEPIPTPTPSPPAPGPPDTSSINTGGAFYGATPPTNPQNGWLWTDGSGALYIYTDPGIWQQIATNW